MAPAHRQSMDVEITSIPPLSPGELSLVNCHSMLNIYNVLRGELTLLGLHVAQDPDLLATSISRCDALVAGLRCSEAALLDATRIEQHERAIFDEIAATPALARIRETDPFVVESLANLQSVFWILRVRARELLARALAPEAWHAFDVAELRADFEEVFRAIEKNSKGRYRLVYNLAIQQTHDYYIDFKVEGTAGRHVLMPAVLKDVMRDLIANARKYTAPGGEIHAALHAATDGLRFVVADTGRGIPASELQTVVHYGRRASNVGETRTMGGGFGLTKAFLVTKQFGGRLWIGSVEGQGTKVRIWLPPCPRTQQPSQPWRE